MPEIEPVIQPDVIPPSTRLQGHHSPRKIILLGLLVIAFFSSLISLWVALAPLHGAAQAPGVVVVDSKRKTIQHLEGGIIQQILVNEGDLVEAGQPVIILESDQTRATVTMLEGQIDVETATMARLKAEKEGLSSIQFPESLTSRAGNPAVAEIIQTETKLFQARLDAFNSQIELLQNQIKQLNAEMKGNTEQLASNGKEIAAIDEQLSANRELLKEGYVTRTMVLDLQRLHAEKTGLRSQLRASIAKGKERELECKLKMTSLKSIRLQEAANDLRNSQSKRFELLDRAKIPKDILDRQIIRAPITGRVVDLKVTTVGGIIASRDPLLDVVPLDDRLIVETKVGVDDISEIQTGQTTEITFTAFKPSTTPTIMGKVTYIAADRLAVKSPLGETPYYLVYVTPDPESLKAAGDLKLYPGMAAQVSIQTKARTALDYFMSPLITRIKKTFHEK